VNVAGLAERTGGEPGLPALATADEPPEQPAAAIPTMQVTVSAVGPAQRRIKDP
jgi:hypothetical protein